MSLHPHRLGSAAALLLAVCAFGAEPPASKLDVNGEPLPPGALARLGTARFRHADTVCCAAFVPGDKLLVSGASDGSLVLWDAKTGKEQRRFEGHKEEVRSLALSPDGRYVVSGSLDRSVVVWRTETGEKAAEQKDLDDGVEAVAFSPDKHTYASAGRDFFIRLWDLENAAASTKLEGHKSGVVCLAFSPDGKRLASGSWDNTVRIWDVSAGKLLFTCEGHKDYVESVAWSHDGKTVASGSKDETVRLWDPDTGKGKGVLEPKQGHLWSVVFDPDDKTLVCGADGVVEDGSHRTRTLQRVDVQTGKVKQTYLGHEGRVRPLDAGQSDFKSQVEGVATVALSSDGKQLVSGGADYQLRLWDAATGKDVLPLPGHPAWVRALAYAPDGKQIVTAGDDPTVRVWTADGKEVQQLRGHERGVMAVAISPAGKMIATGGADQTVRLWDGATGKAGPVLKGHKSYLVGLAFAPDGETLASCESGGTVILWDVKRGEERRSWQKVQPHLLDLAFAPDGKTIAVGGDGGNRPLTLLDTAGAKGPRGLEAPVRRVRSLAYSPDGRLLAVSGAKEHRAYVLDATSGAVVREVGSHNDIIVALAFTPDGKGLLSAGLGRTVVLTDVESGSKRWVYQGHGDSILALAPASDGRSFASASADHQALVWDLFAARDERLTPQMAWELLADKDAAKAWKAVATLATAPKDALPLLRDNLKPVPVVKPEQIAQLVKQLDHDDFDVREKAMAELIRLGLTALPAVKKLLAGNPSVEAKRRAEEIMEKVSDTGENQEWARMVRAVEALEYIGDADARKLLERMASGGPEAQPTRDAKAALGRLEKRAARP
jgi:WD40 repeat protein